MAQEVTFDKLVEDMQVVVRDAEALLKATSAQTGEKLQEVRARVQETLGQARVRLSEIEGQAMQRAKKIAGSAAELWREIRWQAVGIAAGVGLLLGLLLSRR